MRAETAPPTDADHHRPLPTPERLEQVRALHLRGRTQVQIARELHITTRTVRRDLCRLDRLRTLEFAARAADDIDLLTADINRLIQFTAWDAITKVLSTDHLRNLPHLLRLIADAQDTIAGRSHTIRRRRDYSALEPPRWPSPNGQTITEDDLEDNDDR